MFLKKGGGVAANNRKMIKTTNLYSCQKATHPILIDNRVHYLKYLDIYFFLRWRESIDSPHVITVSKQIYDGLHVLSTQLRDLSFWTFHAFRNAI